MSKRLLVLLFLAATAASPTASARDLIYILDASGSMWEQISGRTRIEIAKDVLADQIPSLQAEDTNAGLIVYGHRRRGDCSDIEQLVPLKPLDEREMIAKVESIQPKGKTPISASIRLAAESLKTREDEVAIVLVSDGAENCDPDPCQAVTDLKQAGIEFVLHVVGFDVAPQEERQLRCLARAGDGEYVNAADSDELTAALREIVPPEPVILAQENIQIILDGSLEMDRPFDRTTRLSAAKEAVGDVLDLQVPDRDKLAFRSFGGPCAGEATKLHVGFAQSNVDAIRQSLAGLVAAGEPTLANAITAAAEDFQQPRQFPDSVEKKIIVIGGSDDGCEPQQAAERIYQTLQRHQISPEFHFIGLNLPPDKLAQFDRMAGAAGGYIYNLETTADLTRVLKRIIEIDPVISNVNALIEITGEVTQETNRSVGALNAKDAQSAESALAKASDLMDGGNAKFADLGKRADSSKVFGEIYGIAEEIRQYQHRLLILAGTLIDYAKTDDIDAYNASVNEFNLIVNDMNDRIHQLGDTTAQLGG